MKVLKVFEKRLIRLEDGTVVPKHWDIYNAPRPLPGNMTWQGEFLHGRWYCAVDPEDEFASKFRAAIECLDGWKVIYDCEDQYQRWKADKLKKYAIGPEKVTPAIDENLRHQFLSNSFGKEMPNASNA
jgi:hypothetical protein